MWYVCAHTHVSSLNIFILNIFILSSCLAIVDTMYMCNACNKNLTAQSTSLNEWNLPEINTYRCVYSIVRLTYPTHALLFLCARDVIKMLHHLDSLESVNGISWAIKRFLSADSERGRKDSRNRSSIKRGEDRWRSITEQCPVISKRQWC